MYKLFLVNVELLSRFKQKFKKLSYWDFQIRNQIFQIELFNYLSNKSLRLTEDKRTLIRFGNSINRQSLFTHVCVRGPSFGNIDNVPLFTTHTVV